MLSNFPQSVRIKSIKRETPLVRSYLFEYPVRAKPGQFVNIWVPGVDEKPMSIAFDDGKNYTLAIAGIGNGTKELEKKKVGDYIGIRGPYGTHFSWKNLSARQPRGLGSGAGGKASRRAKSPRIAMLAGGYGAGPLYFAAHLAVKEGCLVDFFLGARGKPHLLFSDRIKKLKNTRFLPSTDDGSAGFKGANVANWTEKMEEGARYDLVLTCGPELMMKSVSDIAWGKKIPAQISVERYMKCGFGICGNCCVDDLGITTCQTGTVMENSVARQIKEFGVYHRDSVGKKRKF